MFSAVSNLSPVNIHTLILAFKKSANVSGTSSYNLSSTAVAPINVRFVSMLFINSVYFLSVSAPPPPRVSFIAYENY
jgi:hypothetical protein